jgi:hypothetical protein
VTARAVISTGKGDAPLERLAKSLRKAAIAWAEMGGDTVPNFASWLDRLRAEPRLKEVGPWEEPDFYQHFEIGMSPAEAIYFAKKYIACNDDARRELWKKATEQKSFERYKRRTSGKFFDDRLGPLSDLGPQLEALARDAERRLKSLQDRKPVAMTVRPQFVCAVRKCLLDTGLKPTATNRVYEDESNATWFQNFMAAINDHLLGDDGWGAAGTYSLPAFYSDITKALR